MKFPLRPSPSWSSLIWQRKTTVIVVLSLAGIFTYLFLRFATDAGPVFYRLPLLIVLGAGGLPMLYPLMTKQLNREFGADLLGGISIVTSVFVGEFLAGSIIVLMLAGGQALESTRELQLGRDGSIKASRACLTSREFEVLQLIAESLPNKQIATELVISIKTVEKHRQRVMDKLNIHDTAGLTRYAISAGIIIIGAKLTVI